MRGDTHTHTRTPPHTLSLSLTNTNIQDYLATLSSLLLAVEGEAALHGAHDGSARSDGVPPPWSTSPAAHALIDAVFRTVRNMKLGSHLCPSVMTRLFAQNLDTGAEVCVGVWVCMGAPFSPPQA